MSLTSIPRSWASNATVKAADMDSNVSVEKRSVAGPAISTTAGGAVLWSVPCGGTLAGLRFCSASTLAASDTNYVSFSVVNKTQGTTIVASATAANTTKATGGQALTAYSHILLTMDPTKLAVNALDVLELSAVVTGTLAGAVNEAMFTLTILPS